MIISHSVLPRMRNVTDKSCKENQNTCFMFNNFFPKIVPCMRLCGKLWYSQRGHRRQYNMAHAHCMPHTLRLQTHPEYVILIRRQNRLHEHASDITLHLHRLSCFQKSHAFNSWFYVNYGAVIDRYTIMATDFYIAPSK